MLGNLGFIFNINEIEIIVCVLNNGEKKLALYAKTIHTFEFLIIKIVYIILLYVVFKKPDTLHC